MSTKDEQPPPSTASALETQALDISPTLKIGDLLAGRFKVKTLIGQGQHGIVYLTDDLQLNIQTAVKLLHPSICKDPHQLLKFKNELLLVRQLSHPNIIRVHEYYSDNEHHFITMDWIDGKTLRERLNQDEVGFNDSIEIITALIKVVQFAQEHGVTHRDIKPENIMFDSTGQLFLADFGLSSFNEHGISEPGQKQQANQSIDAILGTPIYAPPEYLQSGSVNNSTDLYAIGVIAYELIFSGLPFKVGSILEIINAKLTTSVERNIESQKSQFSAHQLALKGWLSVMLSPYPEGRYKSAKEAIDALVKIKSALKKNTENAKKNRLNRFSIGLLSIVALILFSGIFWFYKNLNTESLGQLFVKDGGHNQSSEYYAIAVLGDSKEDHVVDLAHLLNVRLLTQHQFKITSSERVINLVSRLGFSAPYSDSQLRLVMDLLDVDSILLVDSVGADDQPIVFVYTIQKAGTSVIRNVLTSDSLIESKWSDIVSNQISRLSDEFKSKPNLADVTIYPLSERLIEINRQIEKGQLSNAQSELEVLLNNQTEDFMAWFLYGQIHFYLGNIIEAEEAFTNVIKIGPTDAYSVLYAKARVEDLAGNMELAESLYIQLIEASPYRIDPLFELVNFYIYIENFSKAEEYLLKITELDGNHPTAWFELGKIAFHQGFFEKAIDEYFTKALIVAKKLKNLQQEADVLNAFGVVYQQLKELELASDYYQQGLEKYKLVGDAQGVPKALNNLGFLNIHIGKYQISEQQLGTSLELYRSLGDQEGESDVLNDLGVLAEEQGQYNKALTYYRRALEIWQSLGSQRMQASIMNNIAYSYLMLMEPEHAVAYWRQAEQLNQKIQYPLGIIHIRQGLGQLELAKANWKNAYHLFNKTLEDAQQLKSKEFELIAKGYLTKLTFLQGNFSNSINELSNVYQESQSLQDKRAIVEFGGWLAQWYVEIGDMSTAKAILDEIKPFTSSYYTGVKYKNFQLLTALADKENPIESLDSLVLTNPNKAEYDLFIRLLIESARYELRSGSTDISGHLSRLSEVDFSLFQYHYLNVLELRAVQAFLNQDLPQLKQTLREAELTMRRSGQYWRAFHFDRLRIQVASKENKSAEVFKQRLVKKVKALLGNLPAEEQSTFLIQQDYIGIQDGFRDLSQYD